MTKLFPRKTDMAALAAGLIVAPTLALASVTLGDRLGTEDAAITAALPEAGYTVTEIEREDGELEIEALLGDREVEIEISTETGEIIALEFEEDEEEDHDD